MKPRHDPAWDAFAATLQPHEMPMFPGSPATPAHPARKRLQFFFTGLLIAMSGSFGNAAVTANLQNLQGALGITPVEAAWLPVVFVMTNACMNLILVKFRMQYGLRLFTQIALAVFVLVTFASLFAHDYGWALASRAASGVAAAPLTSAGFLYLIQAFPPAHRLKGLILGIGLAGFSVPLARLTVPHLLEIDGWRAVYLLDMGLALMCWAATILLKLPLSQRFQVFDKLDFVTFALFAPGVALLCAVLGLGRIVWWTEAPWIGLALVGAIVLLTLAVIVEHNRRTPLINTRWLAGADLLRLLGAILLLRIVLSEQTSGAVGFLQVLGLGTDQLHGLFAVILAAMVAGTLVSAFTLNLAKLNKPIAVALALIAAGALIDSHSSALTRPANLYFSQALIGFASAMFIGPAMMIGITKVLQEGKQHFISFIVMFSLLQNVGGLAGSALTGTVQVIREKFHSSQLAEGVALTDPQVVQRVQQLSGAYAHTLTDPALRNAEGVALLSRQVTQQANVLAYNDVFLMISALAALGCLWVTINHLRPRWKARRAARNDEAAQAAAVAAAD